MVKKSERQLAYSAYLLFFPIQYKYRGEWLNCRKATFQRNTEYRVDPRFRQQLLTTVGEYI